MTGIYDRCDGWRNWATRGIGEAFKNDSSGFMAPAWKWWCAGHGMTRKAAEGYIAKEIEKWVNEEYEKIYRWADKRFREAITPPSMMDIDYLAIARAVMDDYEDILNDINSRTNVRSVSSSENKKAVPKKRSVKKVASGKATKSRSGRS